MGFNWSPHWHNIGETPTVILHAHINAMQVRQNTGRTKILLSNVILALVSGSSSGESRLIVGYTSNNIISGRGHLSLL